MGKKRRGKTGPEPDRLKIGSDWYDSIKKALTKKRPKEGWPEPEKGKDKENQ